MRATPKDETANAREAKARNAGTERRDTATNAPDTGTEASDSVTKARVAATVQPSIRNIVETPWQQFPGHFGGALSKALVRPETAGSRLVDYRISTYQPMAYVETHVHAVQEQIYHILDGEGSMEIDGRRQTVRRHDVVFIPPGVPHSIANHGLGDLTFIVVTTPVEDR